MGDRISVDITDASDADGVPAAATIRKWVRAAIGRLAADPLLEVSVRIVGEAEGRQLNGEYRDREGATNVLSFPAGEPVSGLPDDVPRSLGDIVVCAPVVAREAAAQGKAPEAHWAHMLVHGSLHLLGCDHRRDDEAEAMEALEKQILADLGVADPYQF